MQIHASTDYAIRMVLYLAKESKTVSSSKLSSALGISPRYLLQIGAKLRDAGFVATTYGPVGGFALARTPQQISLHDIITVMEGIWQNRAATGGDDLPAEFKSLSVAYEYIGSILLDLLRSITIDSLLTQSVNEWYLAPCLLELT